MNWYLTVLKKYVEFSGRASRMEYWMFNLVNFIIIFVLAMLGGFSSSPDVEPQGSIFFFIYVIYILAILLPSLAVTIRRLHDTDRSGFWILINFIPFGGLVLFIFMCLAGTDGDNSYGPDPRNEIY